MRPELPWEDHNFSWENYPPAVRPVITMTRLRALRLTRCSVCGRAKVKRRGSLIPPVLKTLTPTTLRPLAYAVCREHDQLSMRALADILLPGWREHDTP